MYTHFIFDVDGTLVNNEYALLNAWKDTLLEVQGKVWDIKDLTFALGIPGETIMEKAGAVYTEEAFALWREHLKKYSYIIKLFDDIQELLNALQAAGKQLGIITSKTHEEFDGEAIMTPIKHMFPIVMCATDSPRPKPFGDPILTYIQKAKTTLSQVIYIGDSIYDSECARNAGVAFGLAAWGESRQETIKADYIFHTPADVLNLSR